MSCSRPSSRPAFRGSPSSRCATGSRRGMRFDSCMADGRAALDLVARPSLLVGFSMGGAVSIGIASHSDVTGVLGLAPWIPEQLSLDGLRGKRFDVLHGSWDRYLPGIPGVSAASSKRGLRARAGARRRGHVHAHPPWPPRRRGAAPVREAPAASARGRVGRGGRAAPDALSGRERLSVRRAGAARAGSRSAGARSRRGRASRASGS